MSAQKQRCENTGISSNEIESAFETMVQRWLIQGANGELQLAPPKKKTIKKVVLQGDYSTTCRSRKQATDKINRPTEDRVKSTSYSTYMNRKLTADFLQRSKTRLLTGLERCETSNPKFGRQCPAESPHRNDVRLTTMDTDLENTSKTGNGGVMNLSTTEVKMKTPEYVAVFNGEVPPRGDTNIIKPTSSGKRASTSSKQKGVRRAKTSRSLAKLRTVNDQPDSSDVHNAKVEMETEECMRITRITMSTQAENTSAIATGCKVSSEQASDAIPMLSNGQIKCKIEYCYKAAYRGGLCAGHGEDDTCVARGCNNLPYSQGLCHAHVGCKPHTSGENSNDAVQQTTITKVENSEGAESKAPKVKHDVSSNSKSAVASPRPADIQESSSALPKPKVQIAKEHSKFESNLPASNAWHSSDLPSLFRAAGHKREKQTEEAATRFKREKIDHAGTVATRKCNRSRGDRPKVCKVRGCMDEVASDGFCQKHVKFRRCKEDGCGNLAAKGARDFCWCHAARKECQIEGCTKKARVRGRCSEHGGRYICRNESCSKTAYSKGLCVAHLRQARDQPAKQSTPRKENKEASGDTGSSETPTASHCSDECR